MFHVSHLAVQHDLQAQALTAFAPGFSLNDVNTVNSLEDEDSLLLLEQNARMPTVHYQRSGSPKSEFLSCNTTTVRATHIIWLSSNHQ